MEATSTTPSTGVKTTVTKGAIIFDKMYKAQYQKPGSVSVQLRQSISTLKEYPSTKTETSLNASLFSNEEFGFKPTPYTSIENRVAWVNVPEGSKEEDVKKRLAEQAANGATIYRVLSNAPILDENQEYSITQGQKTMDDYANAQAMRYPETPDNILKGLAGKLILNKDAVQYRRTFYWKTPMADHDNRTTDVSKHYQSAEIMAELKGAAALTGQTI